MAVWGVKKWGTFLWSGVSGAFEAAMDALTGNQPLDKILIDLDTGTVDITEYFRGGATFDQRKEIAPDRITSGDTTYTFSNHDDKFTDTDSGSIFYGTKYHNRKIRFYEGFKFADGSTEFAIQATMALKDIDYDFEKGLAYFRCMDPTKALIDTKMNVPPDDTLAVPDVANTGDGVCSTVDAKPFITKNESWTLTCTLGGGDSTATFSVVGTVSGSVGTATSGQEFSDPATGGVKFTIRAGATIWSVSDKFTFKTYQFPQWTNKNPVKIIWGLLTGTNYDTGADEAFKERTLKLDATRSATNTQIHWLSFEAAVNQVYTPVTGYIPQDYTTSTAIEEIHLLFLGSTMIGPDGRLKIKAFLPALGQLPREFSDSKKITGKMKKIKRVGDVINSASCKTKSYANWAWSDESESYDIVYTKSNPQSISDYNEKRHKSFESRWLSVNFPNGLPEAQQWFVDRIVDRYSIPPTKVEFKTGLDALLTELGDNIAATDDDAGLDSSFFGVTQLRKDFIAAPKKIEIQGSQDTTTGVNWAFLGSDADEGDGISPQAANWDSASDSDKQFCYLSQQGATQDPRYYLF